MEESSEGAAVAELSHALQSSSFEELARQFRAAEGGMSICWFLFPAVGCA